MNKKKAIISVVIIILFLAVIAVLGLVVFNWFGVTGAAIVKPELETYTYKGPGGEYEFTVDDTKDQIFHVIHYNANGIIRNVPFLYGPKQLKKEIPMEPDLMDNLVYDTSIGGLKKLIYVTWDPELDEKTDVSQSLWLIIANVVARVDGSVYNIQASGASTEYIPGVPQITCDDASWGTAVIYLRLGDENRIYTEGDCVVLEATNGENLRKVTERLLYLLLKVYYDNLTSVY